MTSPSDPHPTSTALRAAFNLHPERTPESKPTDPTHKHEWRALNLPRMSLLNDSWPHKVQAFRAFYQLPCNAHLAALDVDDIQTHHRIIDEEYNEFWEAVTAGQLLESIDGALDTIYTLLGYLLHIGLTPQQINAAFEEIHASNLTKCDEDGKPVFLLGKVQKTPQFTPPNLPAAFANCPPFTSPLDPTS